jgi:hypothetical protein
MNASIPSTSAANSRPFSNDEQITQVRSLWGQTFWDPRLSLSIDELEQSQSQHSSKLGQDLDAVMDKLFVIDITNGKLETFPTINVENNDNGDDIGSMAEIFWNGNVDEEEISHEEHKIETSKQIMSLTVEQDTLRSNSKVCLVNKLVTAVDDKNTSMRCTDKTVSHSNAEKEESAHTSVFMFTPQAPKPSRPINSMYDDPTLVRPTGVPLPRYGWLRRFLFGKTKRGLVY